jgi:hypothetical protein
MLTPAGDRTLPNKIPKEQIIANNLFVITQKLNWQANKFPTHNEIFMSIGLLRSTEKINVIQENIKFLQYSQDPQNIMLLQYNSAYRKQITNKIIRFSNPADIIPGMYLRRQLAETLTKMTEILISYPFIKEITPKKYLSATVWQNETYYCNDKVRDAKGIPRYRGDIYMDTE